MSCATKREREREGQTWDRTDDRQVLNRMKIIPNRPCVSVSVDLISRGTTRTTTTRQHTNPQRKAETTRRSKGQKKTDTDRNTNTAGVLPKTDAQAAAKSTAAAVENNHECS